MVNIKASPKARILERLRSSPDPVSGEELAALLGMSRVAVWKHLEALREAGYDLVADRSGYRLATEGDFLRPWEFPGREARVHRYESTESTMDRALEIALREPDSLAIVVAETQAKGRGRRGRSWASPTGGLFATVAAPSGLPSAGVGLLPLHAASALCLALRDLTGEAFTVAWPNDVLLEGRKVAGVLAECLLEGDELRLALVGLGVNVANAAPSPDFLSLAELAPSRPTRAALLGAFLDRFEGGLPPGEEVAEAFNTLSSLEGSRVVSRQDGRPLGRAEGVDREGRLVVARADGGSAAFGPGEAATPHKE